MGFLFLGINLLSRCNVRYFLWVLYQRQWDPLHVWFNMCLKIRIRIRIKNVVTEFIIVYLVCL